MSSTQFQSLAQLQKAFPDARAWEFKAYKRHPNMYLAWKKSPLHKGEHEERQFMKFYHSNVNVHPDNPEIWVQWRKLHPLENRPANRQDEKSLHDYTVNYKLGEKDKIEHPTVYEEWAQTHPKNAKDLAAFHKYYSLYAVAKDIEFDRFFDELDMNGYIDSIDEFRKRYPNAAAWELKAYKKNPDKYRAWKAEHPNGSRESYKTFKPSLSKKEVMKAAMTNALPDLAVNASRGPTKSYASLEEFAGDFPNARAWEFKEYQKHPRMFLAWKSENPLQHQEKQFKRFYHAHEAEIKEEPNEKPQMIIDREGTRKAQSDFRRNALRLRNQHFTSSVPEPPHDMTTTERPKLNLFSIHQTSPPVSIPPSEKDRKPTLSLSSVHHRGRDDRIDYCLGVVDGVEADNRIYASELNLYRNAMDRIHDDLDLLPKRTGIHATNDVRAAVRRLAHAETISKRLTGWR